MLITLNGLAILSLIFIAPQMQALSPSSGMQARIAFYTFALNLLALTSIFVPKLNKQAWLIPLLLFALANINLTGLASIDLLFDYGRVGVFWKQ